MQQRLMPVKRLCVVLVVVLLEVSGCALTPKKAGPPKDWAAIVLDLKPSDALATHTHATTIERKWLGFGLARASNTRSNVAAPPPAPPTVRVRLRTGPVNENDPKAAHAETMQVSGIDIGRPRSTTGRAAGPVVIALDPPAASFTFTGGRVEWPYSDAAVVGGVARVSFQRAFLDAARAADPTPSTVLLLRAALRGVTARDLRQYSRLELQPRLAQIIELVRAGIPPATVRRYYAAGYGVSVNELMRLKAADVSVDQATAFAQGGFKLTAAQLIHLRRAGVGPTYAIGMKKAGFADGLEELIRLKHAGVNTRYAAAMRRLGVARSDVQLIQLHRHGVTPRTVRTFQQAKYDPGAAQLIMLRKAGVSAHDALALRQAGYDFSFADLTKLARWNVPLSFTLSLMSEKFKPLSADQIVNLRLRRVTPQMIRLLRENQSQKSPGSGQAASGQAASGEGASGQDHKSSRSHGARGSQATPRARRDNLTPVPLVVPPHQEDLHVEPDGKTE